MNVEPPAGAALRSLGESTFALWVAFGPKVFGKIFVIFRKRKDVDGAANGPFGESTLLKRKDENTASLVFDRPTETLVFRTLRTRLHLRVARVDRFPYTGYGDKHVLLPLHVSPMIVRYVRCVSPMPNLKVALPARRDSCSKSILPDRPNRRYRYCSLGKRRALH